MRERDRVSYPELLQRILKEYPAYTLEDAGGLDNYQVAKVLFRPERAAPTGGDPAAFFLDACRAQGMSEEEALAALRSHANYQGGSGDAGDNVPRSLPPEIG